MKLLSIVKSKDVSKRSFHQTFKYLYLFVKVSDFQRSA